MLHFGHGLESSGYRLYKEYWSNGKNRIKLVSWIDRRCKRCGRFLNTHSHGQHCHKCSLKTTREYQKQYGLDHRKHLTEYKRQWGLRHKKENQSLGYGV